MPKKKVKKVTQLAPVKDLAQRELRLAFNRGHYDRVIFLLETNGIHRSLNAELRKATLAEAYFRRAHQLRETQPARALADFQKAQELFPQDQLYRYHLALEYQRQGKFQDAVQLYEQVLLEDATFSRAYLPLALSLAKLEQDPRNHAIWQRLRPEEQAYFKAEPLAEAPLTVALAAYQAGQYEEARQVFNQIQAEKQVSQGQRLLALDYLGRIAQAQQDKEKALRYWEQAHQMGARHPKLLEQLALASVLEAESLIEQANSAAALKFIEKALSKIPNQPRLLTMQAHLRFELGYEAAQAGQWKKALAAWSNIQNAQGELGRRLAVNLALAYEKLEDWEAAAEAWRDFAKHRPRKEGAAGWLTTVQVARLWTRIATLYLRAGNAEAAVTSLQTALKYDENNLELGLHLVKALAEAERFEAAQNQVDRALKSNPESIEALVLKAQLTEIAPQTWQFGNGAALLEWQKVYENQDETYRPIAKQRLLELYEEELEHLLSWDFGLEMAEKTAQEALSLFPDAHFLRARYICILLELKKKDKVIDAELAKIELSDVYALHDLVDSFHAVEQHKKVAEILEKAEQVQALDHTFYEGIASCALHREQLEIAEQYFDRALKLVPDAMQRKRLLVQKAMYYGVAGYEEQSMELIQAVLAEDRDFGPAYVILALKALEAGDKALAKRHLNKIETWAKRNQDAELLERVALIRQQMATPLSLNFPAGLDFSSLPPPMRAFLESLSPRELAAFLEDLNKDYF